MEALSVDAEESAEDTSGPLKSRIKSLRTRLFVRSKRAGEDFSTKFSQSASDILAGKTLGSEEDLAYPQGIMGSRALSHDSIFWAEQVQTDDDDDSDPVRVLSQENVHSKIKALQMKLQQQKMHLGPPPLVLTIRRQEDEGGRSEERLPPHKSPEFSTVDVPTHGALRKVRSQPNSCPLSPIFKPPASKSGAATTLSPTFIPPGPTITLPCESPLDFSTPAQFTPSLDTSAARHRMSVKPRNQRASTKRRVAERPDAKVYDMNNHPEPVTDEHASEEVIREEEQARINASQQSLPKATQLEVFSSDPTLDRVLPGRLSPVSSQELQVKLQRRSFVMSSQRPRPFFEAKDAMDERRSEESGVEVKILDKSEIVSCSQLSDSCASAVSLPICPQDETEVDSVRGLKRPGSGSFHFSISSAKSRIEDRPRSGSFVGVMGQAGFRHKSGGPVEDVTLSLKERERCKDLHPGGRSFTAGRFRQEQKSSGLPWGRRDSAKNMESAKNMDAVASEELESSQEATELPVVATKVEVKEEEEEGKTMFGFKLRSTSNSIRFWSDGSSRRQSRKPSTEEPSDGLKSQQSKDSESLSKNATAGDFTQTDSALPAKPSPPSIFEAPTLPTDVQTTFLHQSQELQSSPRTASPELSWVSLAMEKTRSLQQLFARRFPKDFTSTAPQPTAQTPNLGEILHVKSQTMRSPECERSEPEGGKGMMEHIESPKKAINTWKEPEVPLAHVNTSQPTSTTNVWMTQSPSRSAPLSDSPSPFGARSTVTQSLTWSYQASEQHPPPWSHRGLHAIAQQPKYTTPAVDEGKWTVQEKESPSLLAKHSAWAGSVSEKAAFLERHAEWCCPSGTKGVELRKAQLETKTSNEPRTQSKDSKPEGREGFKLPESQSPARVPDRPREEKWMRKNLGSSPSPSSSPILRSMPDNAQPSWMELAKRKSMAWSDKTMD